MSNIITNATLAAAASALKAGKPSDSQTVALVAAQGRTSSAVALDAFRRVEPGKGTPPAGKVTSDQWAVLAGIVLDRNAYASDAAHLAAVKAGRVAVSRLRKIGRILAMCGKHADAVASDVTFGVNLAGERFVKDVTERFAVTEENGAVDPEHYAIMVRSAAAEFRAADADKRAGQATRAPRPAAAQGAQPESTPSQAPAKRATVASRLADVEASLSALSTESGRALSRHRESIASIVALALTLANGAGIVPDALSDAVTEATRETVAAA